MVTAKKTTKKEVVIKTAPRNNLKKKASVEPSEKQFDMPQEVKDWIDQAMSRMRSMQNKLDKQAEEIKELKAYRKWAEHRILRSEHES